MTACASMNQPSARARAAVHHLDAMPSFHQQDSPAQQRVLCPVSVIINRHILVKVVCSLSVYQGIMSWLVQSMCLKPSSQNSVNMDVLWYPVFSYEIYIKYNSRKQMCVGCQLLLITNLLVVPRDTALACRSLDTATQIKTWATLAVRRCGRLGRVRTKASMLMSDCVSL